MKKITLTPSTEMYEAEIHIPGSKSYTNRALIMAALSAHDVHLKNVLWCDDSRAMIDCLKKLGIPIDTDGGHLCVHGGLHQVKDRSHTLNARLSGTTIRFITALSCMIPGQKTIMGDEGLHLRPIGILVDGLRDLGADISYREKEGFPPLVIRSSELHKAEVTLFGDVSSQYFSALLMIAPLRGGLTIRVSGNQISKPYIDMTIDMMNDWGVKVVNSHYKSYSVAQGQAYTRKEYSIEGDYSAAGYFAGIAALTKSNITLTNLNPESKQGDREFLTILESMGNRVEYADDGILISGKGVRPVTVDMEACPDQAQTLAVLAAFAQGKTILTGVRSLRVKETERVKAIQSELQKMGITTESPDQDTLIIYGGDPHAAEIETYGDHRMAMSFAMAGSRLSDMIISNPDVVHKTFPDFWKEVSKVIHVQNSL